MISPKKEPARKERLRKFTPNLISSHIPNETRRLVKEFTNIRIDHERTANVIITQVYADVILPGKNKKILFNIHRGTIAKVTIIRPSGLMLAMGRAWRNEEDIAALERLRPKKRRSKKHELRGLALAMNEALQRLAISLGVSSVTRPIIANYTSQVAFQSDLENWKKDHIARINAWDWDKSRIWRKVLFDKRRLISRAEQKKIDERLRAQKALVTAPQKSEETNRQTPSSNNQPVGSRRDETNITQLIRVVLESFPSSALDTETILHGCQEIGWLPTTDNPKQEIRTALSGMRESVLRVDPENQGGEYTYTMRAPFLFSSKRAKRRRRDYKMKQEAKQQQQHVETRLDS